MINQGALEMTPDTTKGWSMGAASTTQELADALRHIDKRITSPRENATLGAAADRLLQLELLLSAREEKIRGSSLDSVPSDLHSVPRAWYDDMRTSWELEKLRADRLERQLIDAAKEIKAASEAHTNSGGWRPASEPPDLTEDFNDDGEPQSSARVLLCLRDGEICTGSYAWDAFNCALQWYPCKPTHWMPLPDAPRASPARGPEKPTLAELQEILRPKSQGRCETTLTERFDVGGCKCDTYAGNLGPCLTWSRSRAADRCVYCDHSLECHRRLSAMFAANSPQPGGTSEVKP